jgi:pyrroline-5-carboxylate reductase
MLAGHRVSFLGGGNMTEALIHGLLESGTARPEQVIVTDIAADRRDYLKSRFHVSTSSDNREAVSQAEIVVLAVEPQVLDGVLAEIQSGCSPNHLLVSVAAGYPIARIRRQLPHVNRIVRGMPNTPSSVRAGVTALAWAPGLPEADRQVARSLFEPVGVVVTVEERLMDAVTGLSGSGPAFVYVMIEALADGGVKAGLPRATAELLAAQTVAGAARMVIETGDHPARLKDRVASPGGTTIAGLHEIEKGRLRAALIAAVEAAVLRSQQLGQE